MECFEKSREGPEEGASGEDIRPSPKRSYESPRLVEWGSMTDLTHGPPLGGETDFPFKGGTKPS